MNKVFQHPEGPPALLPPATSPPLGPSGLYPAPGARQHLSARPPNQAHRLNPFGMISLVMMLLMACVGFVNFIFLDESTRIVLPVGFTWLGAMGLGIGALFMKGREKVTAILALILGVFLILALPLFFFLSIVFIMWVGGGFA